MAETRPYPNLTTTSTRSSDVSDRTSLSSQRTRSDTSVPAPSSSSSHGRSTASTTSTSNPQYQYSSEQSYQTPSSPRTSLSQQDQGDYAAGETYIDAEIGKRIRKRDYAIEVSRIMGRQLVAAMNGAKKGREDRG